LISARVLAWCLLEIGASEGREHGQADQTICRSRRAAERRARRLGRRVSGFGLRVHPSGKRSYIIQYRSRGRSRRYTIGLHGVWTLETARRKAKALLGQVAHGGDPAEEREEDRKSLTVKQLCEQYISDPWRLASYHQIFRK
jgi:hypothetical protein